MSKNLSIISYEKPRPDELVKEELILFNDYVNEKDISSNQSVNAVDQLAVKKEHGGELAPIKMKDEDEDCEVKPFEAIFFNENEDTGVSPFQSNDCDPLAILKEDGIENAVDFEIKEEDEVLAENGDAVSKIHTVNGYPSHSKNGSQNHEAVEKINSRGETIVCESCLQSKHRSVASDITLVPGSHRRGKCQCTSVDKRKPKRPACDKQFQCSYCTYSTSKKSHLKRHMLTHSGDKPFQCSLCEYRSSSKGNLKSHMFTHSGDKPFQCPLCEYMSSEKGNLKRHILTHSGDKPFQCSLCQYRCSRKGFLNAHMLTHSGDKPFQCFLCEYRSSYRRNLKRHMLTHSNNKPL